MGGKDLLENKIKEALRKRPTGDKTDSIDEISSAIAEAVIDFLQSEFVTVSFEPGAIIGVSPSGAVNYTAPSLMGTTLPLGVAKINVS